MAKDNSTANWRFFDNRYGVKGTEAIIQNFLSIAKRIVHPGECQKLISVGLCYHALAGCSRWGTVEPVCREDCDVIFSKCNNELLRLYGAVELMIQNDKINFSHINVPDCKDLPYSYNIDPKKNQSCRFTGLFSKYCNSSLISVCLDVHNPKVRLPLKATFSLLKEFRLSPAKF